MIPRHQPPFGLWTVMLQWLRGTFATCRVADLERQYEADLEVPHAIWLPSARYGMARAVQLARYPIDRLYCPVFNCGAVRHAAQVSEAPIQFVDCAQNSFLMDTSARPPAGQRYAIYLSEMFGHRFSSQELNRPFVFEADLRVFDMAMCIPRPVDMQRLMNDDVAVISFGLGKPLYAGWGGLALTRSAEMAERLKAVRDQDLSQASAASWMIRTTLRTAAHQPQLYAMLRKPPSQARGQATGQFSTDSHEWNRPPTSPHLLLAKWNLNRIQQAENYRRLLQEVYIRRLGTDQRITLSGCSGEVAAQSHFSIRVDRAIRNDLRAALWSDGIDTGTLFPFPQDAVLRSDFPLAAAAAEEVINLPVASQLKPADIHRICDSVLRHLSQLNLQATPQQLRAA